MPTLPELLSQVQFITQEISLLGLFITAGIILIGRDWRSLILTLLVQYILVGLILSRLVRPDIALLKVMVGAFVCPILFLSARQVSQRAWMPQRYYLQPTRPQVWLKRAARLALALVIGRDRRQRPAATGVLFRIFTVLLIMLVAMTLSKSVALPNLPASVNTAVFWLTLAGLVTLTLTEEPIKTGHGLFTALTGFELFYATVENSLLLTGLWGAMNLLIALAIGYLTVIRGTGPEEEW
jgi:hypothetical protein